MSTKVKGKGKKSKQAKQEEAATGDRPPSKLQQMEEKEIETVVEQLIALNIRKSTPQGAEAKPEGREETAAEAAGGSPSSATSQGSHSSSRRGGRGRRERRKYDEKGRLLSNGVDLCDCLNVECPGCFYPCPNCNSNKCGVKCRCNRRWTYTKTVKESGDLVHEFPFDYPN
ncbi:ARL14 effector protein-like [Trichosurus vulpecula]|uniref:ARL14 effector protein-like n=1 Tax=Trichosurus vulpecula TaxID=9337 RepID=UPI00186B00BA|nr:ARL14 effector protein-like [Trichosurus vulpecula]